MSKSIITFARKRLNFEESILLFSISSKFYKYAIHSSFTHMLNMGQLRVQNTILFSPTRGTCGQGQEIVTRTPLRIYAHENSFRDPALRKAARIDYSDCWKKIAIIRHPAKTNKSRPKTFPYFPPPFLLILISARLLKIVIGKGSVSPTFLQCFSFRARARLNRHCQ